MSDQSVAVYARTSQTISARVLAESRRTYGEMVDDLIIQAWVSVAIGSLLTEQTRVTQFVPVLAMRQIRELASNHVSSEAA
jgi:hypothetical protein